MTDVFITTQIKDSIAVKTAILSDSKFLSELERACRLCVDAYRGGKKMLIAGNGGSAADAQHIAGELVSRFYYDRPALPAIALTTDTSILTAIGNDYGYENLFSRQIEANGVKGDVFVAISTSGNSPNVIKAIAAAKERGIFVIGLTGETGGKIAPLCDVALRIPSRETPRVQESHLMIGHVLCAYIEKEIFPK
jgi:D-sedoheptulose 7-phosphate isomerase